MLQECGKLWVPGAAATRLELSEFVAFDSIHSKLTSNSFMVWKGETRIIGLKNKVITESIYFKRDH